MEGDFSSDTFYHGCLILTMSLTLDHKGLVALAARNHQLVQFCSCEISKRFFGVA